VLSSRVRAFLGFVYGLWVLTGAVLSGLVIGTLGVLPFAVLPRVRRFPWTMPAVQLWARTVLWLLRVRFEVRGIPRARARQESPMAAAGRR